MKSPLKGTYLRKTFNVKATPVEDYPNALRFTFSSGIEDRHGEIVAQDGWKLDKYLLNPVVLFGHDMYQPAIGQCVAIGYDEKGNLEGIIQFAVEEYEFAKTIYNLYKGGYMRAVSVGFQNEVIEFDQEEETITLKENELYEVSCVNVPANAEALAKAKSAGIDLTPLDAIVEKVKGLRAHETAVAENMKEGRVLSKKNREKVAVARDALDELLSADDDKGKDIGDDSRAEPSAPATPAPRTSHKAKALPHKRAINKAVRRLLKEKLKR